MAHLSDHEIVSPTSPIPYILLLHVQVCLLTSSACLQELAAAYEATDGKGPPEASFDNFKLVQLDQPVKVQGLTIIDNLQSKPERINFTNCYFHDGHNCGIVSKAAVNSLIANCVVERTSVEGIQHSVGGEGAFAGAPQLRCFKIIPSLSPGREHGNLKALACHECEK